MTTDQRIERQLKLAQQREAIARLKLSTATHKKRLDIVQKFDFIDPALRGKRRAVKRESGKTPIQSNMHTRADYLQGYASARDSVRNNDLVKSIINQLAFNVVGSIGGKVSIEPSDAKTVAATDWFWHDWARNCDGSGYAHWNVKLKQILVSALTDGGVINVFDDFSDDADGRLYTYTLDFVTPVGKPERLPDWKPEYQHKDGWLFNGRGRLIGCCIGKERGLQEQDVDDVSTYYFGDSAWPWMPWICSPLVDSQVGVSLFSSAWLNLEGIKEMRAKELDTAGIAAAIMMQILTDDSPEGGALLAAGGDPDSIVGLEDLDAGEAADTVATARDNWEEFEAMRGARIHYANAGEKAEMLNLNRPNLATETYYNTVATAAGASIGMGAAYTHLKATASYTAYRGEQLMTWAGLFTNLQKELERDVCDRVARKAIEWGASSGKIKRPTQGWALSFHWPQMPEVDQNKFYQAIEQAFALGLATPAKYLGPGGDDQARRNREINAGIGMTSGLSQPNQNPEQEDSDGEQD